MRTILLKDEDTICIEMPDEGDDSGERHIHFVFPGPVCAAELLVVMWGGTSHRVSFEPASISLPKLTCLACCDGYIGVFECLLKIIDAPAIEQFLIQDGDMGDIPEEIFRMKTLQSIDITNKVPYSVPDVIRNLVNLERFVANRSSPIEYLSPELFRLPRIQHIDLKLSNYEATPEVLAAAETFVAAGGFLKIWNEVGDASKLPSSLTGRASLPKT